MTENFDNVASRRVSYKPQPVTHRTASAKHIFADSLHKLRGRTGMFIIRSLTFSSTCRLKFTRSTSSTSNAFHPNTQGKTVCAYASRTCSLTGMFTPSSSCCLLRRMLWPPHSCVQSLRAPREQASKGRKRVDSEERDHMDPHCCASIATIAAVLAAEGYAEQMARGTRCLLDVGHGRDKFCRRTQRFSCHIENGSKSARVSLGIHRPPRFRRHALHSAIATKPSRIFQMGSFVS